MSNIVQLHPNNEAGWSASTPTCVCPDLVDPDIYGDHRSTVVNGERVWWFESEDARAMFAEAAMRHEFKRRVPANA